MNNNKIAIVGDIHGCLFTLTSLLKKIKSVREIYSVGDLIDRGRYSKEVIQFCIEKKIKPVRGNHEDLMLKAVESQKKYFGLLSNDEDVELYYYNGGRETQYSYINSRLFSNFKKFKEEIISSGHYEWIKKFPLKYEFEKVILSHAGIVEGGDEESILWNRQKPAHLDKLQVFGHTPHEKIIFEEDYFINLDTGCVYGNKLSSVIIDTGSGKIIDFVDEEMDSEDKKR